MKLSLIVILGFLALPTYSFVQGDTIRVEIPIRPNEVRPLVVPMDSSGFALLDKRQENLLDPSNVIKITGYNKEMKQVWKKQITHNRRLSLRLYEFQQNKLYLIFGSQTKEEVEFYVLDPKSGEVAKYDFFYLDKLLIEDFTALNDDIYVLGTLKNLPVLLGFNLSTKKVASFPMAVSAKNVEVLEVFNDREAQISATLSMEVNKTKQILTKTFDVNTKKGQEFIVKPSKDYDLMNGKVTVLNSRDKLVIGTYGYRNRQESQGMYVAGYVGDREVIKKYYRFTDMKNFFSFLSEKEQKKMEERVSKKAGKGKNLRLKYRLLVHEAVVHNGQYVMVGEAYYPTYRSEQFRRYGPRGYYYDTRIVFDGYRFTHAVVAAIDKRGDLVWDHSFEINDTKTFRLKERVKLLVEPKELTLIYNIEGEIFKLQIKDGEILEEASGIDISTKHINDRVKNSDLGEAEYWFNNYFLAWGYQKIKNNQGESNTNKRNVFYINKLSY